MDEDDNKFKITCQCCNGFVTCSVRSGEVLYTNFLHAVISTLGLYPQEIVLKFSTFSGLPELKYNTYIKGFERS